MTEQELEYYMDTYTSYLLRIGYYYTKDIERSKDLAQDVFLKLYYSSYEERGNMKAYIGTLMANCCKDYLKSWAFRKITVQQLFQKEPRVYDSNSLIEQDERDAVEAAILQLKIPLREVIVFYYMEELTTKEIAQLLNTPESTIKTRLKTARKQLHEALQHIEWEVLYNG